MGGIIPVLNKYPRSEVAYHTSLRANYSQPEIYDKIAATALSANAVLSLLVYIRPTHESAQSFRPCVYGQFDIRNPWSETRASLSTRAISTVDVVTSTQFLSKLYRKHTISPHRM
jgi:hypothetical protein